MTKDESTIFHPIGAGSHVYKECLLEFIKSQLPKKKVKISIGAQPNSVPHFGTLIVFCLAFSTAKELMKRFPDLECSILFEMVDTAPAKTEIIDNIEYQISLRNEGLIHLELYKQLLSQLSDYHNVEYTIRPQADFNKSVHIREIVSDIIKKQHIISTFLAPDTKNLRIRAACPICGRSDKKAKKLMFLDNEIESYCPYHGKFSINLNSNIEQLEYNTPLRNLIRHLNYLKENQDTTIDYCWLRITGSDYAGFYQEQTLYKSVAALGYPVQQLPLILYAPLVVDWSGAKLSKSLYLKHDAYKELPPYLLDYTALISSFGLDGLKLLSDITDEWIRKPYMLFRSYSVDYFLYRFTSKFGGERI